MNPRNDIIELREKFGKIRARGWIEADADSFENAGIMFEKLIGVQTNALEIPDFGGIEIKTKSKSPFDYVSLFNCSPTGPHYHEIEYIRDSFGYPDSEFKFFKVFYGDVFCSRLSRIGQNRYFRLKIDEQKKKIILSVCDAQFHKIAETTYWDFDILEEKLNRKLPYLALINVEKRHIDGRLFFKYSSLYLYKLKDFDAFIKLMEAGLIKVSFKIGVFKSEKRFGKIYDRGTAFAIKEKYIDKLFDCLDRF